MTSLKPDVVCFYFVKNVSDLNEYPFSSLRSVVTPSSFVYGNSIDSSRFIQLEDMKCNFQPLNLTFQVLLLARVFSL